MKKTVIGTVNLGKTMSKLAQQSKRAKIAGSTTANKMVPKVGGAKNAGVIAQPRHRKYFGIPGPQSTGLGI